MNPRLVTSARCLQLCSFAWLVLLLCVGKARAAGPSAGKFGIYVGEYIRARRRKMMPILIAHEKIVRHRILLTSDF